MSDPLAEESVFSPLPMILALRGFFIVVLLSMLAVTGWASAHGRLFSVPFAVVSHPWFIATLYDAYWGFLTFYVLVFYQQTSWLARIVWLAAILLLGNIAMSAYCLEALFRVPFQTTFGELLVQRREQMSWLAPFLATIGVAVLFFA